MFDLSSSNITITLILIIILILIVYFKYDVLFYETFDNTEIDKIPKLTYVQDMELKKLLKIIHVSFISNKIDYSMCGNTILGAIRHKNRIPWDTDASIFIFDKDVENFEKIDWKQYGCKIYKDVIGYKFCFIDLKKQAENNNLNELNYPFVNIFVFDKFPEKYTHKSEKCRQNWPTDFLHETEIFPLKLYQYDDMMLYGPNKAYSYINRYFGTGWEINAEIKSSQIAENNDTKTIKFTISDYAKKNNMKSINYLWIIEKMPKYTDEDIIDKFNKDYTIVFVNKNTLNVYLPDIYNEKIEVNLDDKEQIKLIRSLLFKKHGGKFLVE
jgi:phosphorylcholine metabolism protein LicD